MQNVLLPSHSVHVVYYSAHGNEVFSHRDAVSAYATYNFIHCVNLEVFCEWVRNVYGSAGEVVDWDQHGAFGEVTQVGVQFSLE